MAFRFIPSAARFRFLAANSRSFFFCFFRSFCFRSRRAAISRWTIFSSFSSSSPSSWSTLPSSSSELSSSSSELSSLSFSLSFIASSACCILSLHVNKPRKSFLLSTFKSVAHSRISADVNGWCKYHWQRHLLWAAAVLSLFFGQLSQRNWNPEHVLNNWIASCIDLAWIKSDTGWIRRNVASNASISYPSRCLLDVALSHDLWKTLNVADTEFPPTTAIELATVVSPSTGANICVGSNNFGSIVSGCK